MRLLIPLVLPSLLLLAGCPNQEPRSGVVAPVQTGQLEGQPAPDVPFTSLDGRPTSLHTVRQPLAIVGFVESPPDSCCWFSPELVRLAARYNDRPVTIVQVALPTAACPHGAGCIETCQVPQLHMMALCDPQRIAWRRYGQPEANTVFLIDDHGTLAASAPLKRLDRLSAKADDLSRRLIRDLQPSN